MYGFVRYNQPIMFFSHTKQVTTTSYQPVSSTFLSQQIKSVPATNHSQPKRHQSRKGPARSQPLHFKISTTFWCWAPLESSLRCVRSTLFRKKKTSCQPEKNMLLPRNPVKWPRATRARPRLPGSPGYKLPWPPSPSSSVLAVTSPANHEPGEWRAGRQASSVVSARVVAAFEFHAEGRRPRAPRLDG